MNKYETSFELIFKKHLDHGVPEEKAKALALSEAKYNQLIKDKINAGLTPEMAEMCAVNQRRRDEQIATPEARAQSGMFTHWDRKPTPILVSIQPVTVAPITPPIAE